MNTRLLKIMEISGCVIIYLIAVFLHFVFDISNGSALSILFGAVNESVWEHIKIFAAGYAVWAVIEILVISPSFKKFVVAKTISLYALSAAIIVFFYSYTFFTNRSYPIVDIISSFIFVILSQYLSYILYVSENNLKDYFYVCTLALMTYFIMFFSFTLFPPRLDLFRDPLTGSYGIIDKYMDAGAFYLDKSQ